MQSPKQIHCGAAFWINLNRSAPYGCINGTPSFGIGDGSMPMIAMVAVAESSLVHVSLPVD
jgi:hypothetical protein